MKKFQFKGIIATAFTPFHDNKEKSLNLPVIPKIAEHFANNGFKLVLINGTYGEGPSMTADERMQVAEAWSDAAKKTNQQLIIQVGGTNLPDAKKLASHAQSLEASALLCLPELYYKPRNVDELIDYLGEVAEAAPKVPFFYYHSPLATGVNVNMAEFFDKVKDRIPTLAGIKFAVPQMDDCTQALRHAKAYKVIVASNHNLPAYISMGIDTFMPTAINIDAKIVNKIYELAINNEYPAAARLQAAWSEFIDRVASLNNGTAAPVMKRITTRLTKIDLGPPRKPLQTLDAVDDKIEINNLIERHLKNMDNMKLMFL